jgi:hypothetical protein
MILVITDRNAWEHESWNYVIDMEKQDAYSLSLLMTFIEHANRYFRLCKEAAGPPKMVGWGFFRVPINPVFAASSYSVDYYDSVEQKGKRVTLIRKMSYSTTIDNIEASGYLNFWNLHLDQKISTRIVKKAVSKISAVKGKKENILYKCFESVLLPAGYREKPFDAEAERAKLKAKWDRKEVRKKKKAQSGQ